MSFKMHKIVFFFPEKKSNKKYVCLPNLKFSDLLPETHLFFIWPSNGIQWRFRGRRKKSLLVNLKMQLYLIIAGNRTTTGLPGRRGETARG